MSGLNMKRINKEITSIQKSKDFKLAIDEREKTTKYYISFKPESGLYETQTHIIEIMFEYGNGENIYTFPLSPPNIKFITPILHPNVGIGGSVCLDVIKDKWSPLCSVETVIIYIIALLNDPNPSSPLNGDAGSLFQKAKKQNDYTNLIKEINTHYLKNISSYQKYFKLFESV